MRRFLPLLASSLALAACTVGPNYAGPPKVASVGAQPFARGGQSVAATAPGVARWWETLDDPTLNAIETQALAANPDLAIAQARLREARASLRQERANQRPNASATAAYLHARLPGVNLGQVDESDGSTNNGANSLDFFNVGFDASWEVDLFGGGRRQIQAARANEAAAEANVADAQVSLSAEVAQAYVSYRDRQRRLALAIQSSQMQRQMLALTRQRFDRGTASQLDIERLTNQVATTDADRVPLAAELDGYRDELAVLTGQAPGALDPVLAADAAVPLPPAQVPVGDPAALIQRRPDIRAAERRLAAQTARIGVAEAARFPRLSFMGIIGIGGTGLGDVVNTDDIAALVAPQLSWSFLDFGRNAAKVEQARGSRDEAEAQYRSAVLGALRDAEDSLSRFDARRRTVASLAEAKASADRAAALTDQRYLAGTTTLTDELDAQRQRIAAEQSLSEATAGLTTDFVAIEKALGLGWSA